MSIRDLLPRRARGWLETGRLARLRRLPTALLGPEFTPDRRRIELDITHACQLGCIGCNRSCGQAPSSEEMTVEQVERFVQESGDTGWKWDEITLTGGEPTEHRRFLEIVDAVVRFARASRPMTRVVVKTNGWSAEKRALVDQLPPDVKVADSKKQSADQPHFSSFNVAPCDLPEYARVDYSNACPVPEYSGLALTRAGYYCCAVAASIDRVLGIDAGVKKLLLLEGAIEEQLRVFCRRCGHFKRAETHKPGDLSPFWQNVYSQYRRDRPVLSLY